MHKDEIRDPWLNESRTPSAAAWEAALRPPRSSNRALVLLAAAAVAFVAFVVFDAWRNSNAPEGTSQRQSAPQTPAQVEKSPMPHHQRSELGFESGQRVVRLAKCTTPAGAAMYSDGPCPPGTRASEVLVKPDSNLAEGMSTEARQALMRRNSIEAQAIFEHERRVAMNVDTSGTECAQLNALIVSIDAAARQPQSGFEQDRLKDQRRRARDRQFALRCG